MVRPFENTRECISQPTNQPTKLPSRRRLPKSDHHNKNKTLEKMTTDNDVAGNGGATEDQKPADGAVHINLKVKGQDGNEVFFRIKRTTALKKLMNAYCDRQSVDPNSIAFLFDGRRLRGDQTPDELEMEDSDEIDAMLHQTGGH